MNISPATQKGLQIAPFSVDKILSLVQGEPNAENWQFFEVDGVKYRVNIGTDRYFVFKQSRICACCGLHGTHMYLDKNVQQTKETGVPSFHFNLYGVNTDNKTTCHFTLMMKNHIVPKSMGGTEQMDNFQTFCFYCSCLKEITGSTIEQMRKVVYPAHCIFKSTVVLNKAKASLEPYRARIIKNRHAANAISEALKTVTDKRVEQMKEKMSRSLFEAEWLEQQCNRIEIEAQVTGVMPDLAFLDERLYKR